MWSMWSPSIQIGTRPQTPPLPIWYDSTNTPQSDAWSFLYKILGGILELILKISSSEVFPIFSPKLGSGEGEAITLETIRRLQDICGGRGGAFCRERIKIQRWWWFLFISAYHDVLGARHQNGQPLLVLMGSSSAWYGRWFSSQLASVCL